MANRVTALCCECGTTREIDPDRSILGGNRGEVFVDPGRRIESLGAYGGHRCTLNRKCKTCGAITLHAYLCGDENRDEAERLDQEQARPSVLYRRGVLEELAETFRTLLELEVEGWDGECPGCAEDAIGLDNGYLRGVRDLLRFGLEAWRRNDACGHGDAGAAAL